MHCIRQLTILAALAAAPTVGMAAQAGATAERGNTQAGKPASTSQP